jgi:hypothetical protein
MHPDVCRFVCRFVSEIMYDRRLEGLSHVAAQRTAFGTGLRYLPVEHVGNIAAAPEEGERVAREIAAMRGAPWTNAQGETRPLGGNDFMVVAPYNAQVRQLRQALEAAGLADVPVGTVDKFQGREAAVVFYSMATSSAEDVPRSLEFLSSRAIASTSPSRVRCAWPKSSPALACSSPARERSNRCDW